MRWTRVAAVCFLALVALGAVYTLSPWWIVGSQPLPREAGREPRATR
jgi:hypothetical protein